MRWVWDPEKDAVNRRKHGLPLSLAEIALADPLGVTLPDAHPDGDRWNTVAAVAGATLFVVHTWPEDDIPGRIISVRQATRSERKAYEDDEP
jgi:uncharacterized DUF497 family protein